MWADAPATRQRAETGVVGVPSPGCPTDCRTNPCQLPHHDAPSPPHSADCNPRRHTVTARADLAPAVPPAGALCCRPERSDRIGAPSLSRPTPPLLRGSRQDSRASSPAPRSAARAVSATRLSVPRRVSSSRHLRLVLSRRPPRGRARPPPAGCFPLFPVLCPLLRPSLPPSLSVPPHVSTVPTVHHGTHCHSVPLWRQRRPGIDWLWPRLL